MRELSNGKTETSIWEGEPRAYNIYEVHAVRVTSRGNGVGISWGRSGERERGNTAMRNWGNGRHRCNDGRNGCEEGWKCRRTGYRDQGRYLKDWNEKGAKARGRTESMDWREWLGYDGNDAMETGRPVEEERQLDRQGGR